MHDPDEKDGPGKTKAVLIDPASMAVLWTNASASGVAAGSPSQSVTGVALEEVVPMAETLGVHQAVSEVAKTGVPWHTSTGVVSMARGSITLVISIYRLPDGKLLLLMENAWQVGRERSSGPGRGRGRRRSADHG